MQVKEGKATGKGCKHLDPAFHHSILPTLQPCNLQPVTLNRKRLLSFLQLPIMSQHNNRKEVLLFLHIPKTAGTTLTSVLMRQYPPESIFEVYGLVPDQRIEELRALSPDRRRAVQCVIGHFYFGLDALFDAPGRYITMLRDPVERVISSYYHILRTPENWLYQDVAGGGMTLEQYVNCEGRTVHESRNMQTRMLAGAA